MNPLRRCSGRNDKRVIDLLLLASPLVKSLLDPRTDLTTNSFSSRCFSVHILSNAPVFQYNVVPRLSNARRRSVGIRQIEFKKQSPVDQIAAPTRPQAFLFPYCWQQ